jgi:hypothetical protein
VLRREFWVVALKIITILLFLGFGISVAIVLLGEKWPSLFHRLPFFAWIGIVVAFGALFEGSLCATMRLSGDDDPAPPQEVSS